MRCDYFDNFLVHDPRVLVERLFKELAELSTILQGYRVLEVLNNENVRHDQIDFPTGGS